MDDRDHRDSAAVPAVDEIDNLDTARMALRWALERLHSLERLTEELDQKLDAERGLRAKAEKECRDLKGQTAPTDPREKKRYYEMTEQYALRALAGKLGIEDLVSRELEAARLKESARLLIERLRQDETAARLTVEKINAWESAAHEKLERLRELEARLLRKEDDVAAVQRRLEAEYASREAELRADLEGLRSTLADALRRHEKLLAESREAVQWADEAAEDNDAKGT